MNIFGVGDNTGYNVRDVISGSIMKKFGWSLMSQHQCDVISPFDVVLAMGGYNNGSLICYRIVLTITVS
jgi:hypothetical protein